VVLEIDNSARQLAEKEIAQLGAKPVFALDSEALQSG
jgi:hypothetical protein